MTGRFRNLERIPFQSFVMLFPVLLIACGEKSGNGESDKSTVDRIFHEEALSKFEILEKKEVSGYTYSTVESNYRPVPVQLVKFDERQYFAHLITITKRSTAMEGQDRNIKVKISAFDKPAENVVEIDRDCDDIDLLNNTYRTVKYGCCGALNHYEIFNYNNKPIIEGDGNIVTGNIPNSIMSIYSGFINESKDSTTFGTFYYSTNLSERFAIKIKGRAAVVTGCGEVMPEITFFATGRNNTFDSTRNEYTLWSFDKVENAAEISNLKIRLKMYCMGEQNMKAIEIPIMNGMPFGKNIHNQTLTVP
jgi:hypothetical protein